MDAEDDRRDARDDQEQLVRDILAEPDRGPDLEDSRHDRPGRDQEPERMRRDARINERQNADSDADEALQDEKPPAPAVRVREAQRLDDRENAVRERERAEEDDEGEHRRDRSAKRTTPSTIERRPRRSGIHQCERR